MSELVVNFNVMQNINYSRLTCLLTYLLTYHHDAQVEVAAPRYKTVNLGALMIGQTVRRSIPVVNRSLLPVTMSASLSAKDPDCQDISVLRLLTTSQTTIQPPKQHGRRKVEDVTRIIVAFTPKKRMRPFVEEVCMPLFAW